MAADDKGATGAQTANSGAGPETQPPAGTSPTQTANSGASQESEDQSRPESDLAKKQVLSAEDVQKLRSEMHSLRLHIKELEVEKAKADEAKLSDTEKAIKHAAENERKALDRERAAQERVLRYAAEAEALRLGMESELAYRLLDHSLVEYDDEGQPTNLREQLNGLAKRYPQLLAKPGGGFDGGVRGPAAPATPDMNTLLRRAAGPG